MAVVATAARRCATTSWSCLTAVAAVNVDGWTIQYASSSDSMPSAALHSRAGGLSVTEQTNRTRSHRIGSGACAPTTSIGPEAQAHSHCPNIDFASIAWTPFVTSTV